MIVVLLQIVMSAATVCFAAGFAVRHSNNALHRKLMATGFVLTAAIAVVLVIAVNVFGATYGPADWLLTAAGGETGARGVLIAHRIVATVTFLFLLAQVITGWRRHPLHHRLYKAVVPLWLITYVSGMTIFQ